MARLLYFIGTRLYNKFSISKTKQRSYEWCGSFATAAIIAIQDLWNSDPQYASAEDRANFVEWAIPAEDTEPSLFIWASVDENHESSEDFVNLFFNPPSHTILTNNRYIKVASSQLPS